jgi:hypothetical protein
MWKTWTGNSQAMGPVASPQSRGPGAGALGQWHPTIIYLGVLLAAEVFLVGLLSRTILS